MRENLSLLSFWGLVFSLIAVTLFVVIYSYQKSKYANRNIVEDLRQRSVAIYLAAETREAETDSKKFREAAEEIERLRAETGVLFWLIIAINAAVIIIFRVPDRGSGNPTPLGGWDRGASHVNCLDGSVQARQPYRLGLQIPLGVGHEVSLPRPWWGRRDSVPGIAARDRKGA